MTRRDSDSPLPEEALDHYAKSAHEEIRLQQGTARLEFARTKQILKQLLPGPPATIIDSAGGTGPYACWLARRGYTVHLVDAVPHHVELARQASARQSEAPLASAETGDARQLHHPDQIADAVLLLGPLYHLTERQDRVAAIRESLRVCKPNALVFAAAISRFASLLDGLRTGVLQDPTFERIVDRDLETGQHRNPSDNPDYFTTAYFHHPSELRDEIEEAGLIHERTIAIEGPGWLLQDFEDHWSDPRRRAQLLSYTARLETEPSLLGASAHIMAVGRRAG